MNKPLNIPNDLSSFSMTKNVDGVTITVTADCTWCYSDSNGCFPNGLLAPGYYTATNPHTSYGPYTPNKAGNVGIGAVPGDNPCTPGGGTRETMGSITINN